MTRDKIIFLFLDGFGLAPMSDRNPMGVFNVFGNILGKPLTSEAVTASTDLVAKGLDATLGVPGIPQSATGQTALFTGENAAKVCGGHIPAFPPPELQSIIKTKSLFKTAKESGLTATFANCYREQYFEMVKEGKREHSVTTLSVMAADLPLRTIADYHAKSAIFYDVTGEHIIFPPGQRLPPISAFEAGKRICGLCRDFDLVVFETFLPDVIGHKRDWEKARRFAEMLNNFIESIIAGRGPATTIVLTSDHGNFEDFSTGGHTMNPAALFAFGPGAGIFKDISSIEQIPRAIMHALLRHRASLPDFSLSEPPANNFYSPRGPLNPLFNGLL